VQLLYKCPFPYKISCKLTKAFQFCMLNCEMGSEVCSEPDGSRRKKINGL